jgi:hypothetical protein
MIRQWLIPISLVSSGLVIALIIWIYNHSSFKGQGEYGLTIGGEAGGFMFLQLNKAPVGINLVKATFDFSQVPDLISDNSAFGGPVNNNGVNSYDTFISSSNPLIFGFTATGFDSGDDLLLQAPRISKSNGQIPTAVDLYGGQLILTFSNGKQITSLFSMQGRNALAVVTNF